MPLLIVSTNSNRHGSAIVLNGGYFLLKLLIVLIAGRAGAVKGFI